MEYCRIKTIILHKNKKRERNAQYQVLFGGGNIAAKENQKESFLPHGGFPHNNLAIPPCLVFW